MRRGLRASPRARGALARRTVGVHYCAGGGELWETLGVSAHDFSAVAAGELGHESHARGGAVCR